MKRKYKLLLNVLGIEYFIVIILSKLNIKVQSWIGNAIGSFVFLLPVQILLFMLGRDEDLSNEKRMCFKIAFWFINICYLAGGVASLVWE